MEENFNVVAQSRANYYTPGSPIQFVRIEVLKGDQSGENAICLTFKNIAQAMITRLSITFKCKGADGSILCEQAFTYEDLEVKSGELFGMDDAVFVTADSIGSADVVLEKVYSGKKVMNLSQIKRVRLPALQKLEPEMQQELATRMGRDDLKFMPQLLEAGWYCGCGAFHPKEENTVYCSECSSDRILLQNTINAIMQPVPVVEPTTVDEPTVVAQAQTMVPQESASDAEGTKMFAATKAAEPSTVQVKVPQKKSDAAHIENFAKAYKEDQSHNNARYDDDSYQDYDEDEEAEDPRDVMAENIIRWVPAITALLCAGIAIAGFCYCYFVL
ncbi:MAG: hypothetical protein R3Y06_04100 [Faecalibacterium sp.]